LDNGFQAYVVYSAIEESDFDIENSTNAYKEYKKNPLFKSYKIGHINGNMSSIEINKGMMDFKNNTTQILICTTV
jgi:RecG-like helicase